LTFAEKMLYFKYTESETRRINNASFHRTFKSIYQNIITTRNTMTTKNKQLEKLPFTCPLDAGPHIISLHNLETDQTEVWFISDIFLYETQQVHQTRMHFTVRNSNGDQKTFRYLDEKPIPNSKPNSLDAVRKRLAQGQTLHATNYKFSPHLIMNELRDVFNELEFEERGPFGREFKLRSREEDETEEV